MPQMTLLNVTDDIPPTWCAGVLVPAYSHLLLKVKGCGSLAAPFWLGVEVTESGSYFLLEVTERGSLAARQIRVRSSSFSRAISPLIFLSLSLSPSI